MKPDVIIVGGGLIGLASAWKSRIKGMAVTVVDPHFGKGTSHVAAGMLAPVTEAHYGEEEVVRINSASAAMYPSFVEELEEASSQQVGYRDTGTLVVAGDPSDRAALTELVEFHQSLGLDSEWIAPTEARRLEPSLAPSIAGAILAQGDHQVDNRRLISALIEANRRAGTELITGSVKEFEVSKDKLKGVLLDNGARLESDNFLLAAGVWSNTIPGIPEPVQPTVRPVKGQSARLHFTSASHSQGAIFPRYTLRALVKGVHVYMVPRESGEMVLGATMEERGFDTSVTAGGLYELLRNARQIFPGITELELSETIAGLRPATPGNLPLLGASGIPGLTIATGHGRNGVLLTPLTAEVISDYLTKGELSWVLEVCSTDRYKQDAQSG
ncbi:MAG: glycine oxidase ThiO [Actinobacteria bacterium]|jgi:glycine oxidase|nr:glycine oxidase ThiO [Actinomycetota bacterium]MCL6094883.1 glycine oxidase ThiO [Actinomycetota bacterium]